MAVFITIGLQAQNNCNNYFALEEGVRFEMTYTGKKGEIVGVSKSEVLNVIDEDGMVTAEIEGEMVDETGEQVHRIEYRVSCKDGEFKMDFQGILGPGLNQSVFEDLDIEIEGDLLSIPANLEVGDTLPDAYTSVQITGGGVPVTTTYWVTKRKVKGEEKVTTPAGTFDCVKITYILEYKMLIGKTMMITEWISPGYGVVKTKTTNKKGNKVLGESELTLFDR